MVVTRDAAKSAAGRSCFDPQAASTERPAKRRTVRQAGAAVWRSMEHSLKKLKGVGLLSLLVRLEKVFRVERSLQKGDQACVFIARSEAIRVGNGGVSTFR